MKSSAVKETRTSTPQIGNTPLVPIKNYFSRYSSSVYAKLEYTNPGGSIKDRVAYWLIKNAEISGSLQQGGTVIEATSGNTGIGLAMVTAKRGYKCICVVPDKTSDEKIQAMKDYGATVVVTPSDVQATDPRSYFEVARRLSLTTPNSIHFDQYNNLQNQLCHYSWTGPEVYNQLPVVDVYLAGIGTGGTISGVAKYLKSRNPKVKVIGIEPEGSSLLDFYKHGKIITPPKPYLIEGIGRNFVPKNLDFGVIDEIIQVKDLEAFTALRKLRQYENISAGLSSGAVLSGTEAWLKSQSKIGQNILIMLTDSGSRYLSKIANPEWMKSNGIT